MGEIIFQEHPITLSLFSGAGGLDIGFHQAGFRIVACVEIDRDCCRTLELNRDRYLEQGCQIVNKDICEFVPEDIDARKIDFIIGGPPCQSFSAIGRRAGGAGGMLDERGNLFENYCRLVEYYRPEGFLFENVRGILGSNSGKDWRRIVEAFENLGYRLFYRILDTADYGVPQHRERLILVGVKDGTTEFKFPRPVYGPDSLTKKPYVTALDAIADLQDPLEPIQSYNGKYGKLLEEVPPGQNYHYFTKELGYPEPRFAWRSRFSDFLYKADPDKPVRTIVATLGAYSGPFHWKNRKFTLQEFKRLQSFPDDYQFAGSLNSALHQIGNSVAPRFAKLLAQSVLHQLFGVSQDICFIEVDNKLTFDRRKSITAKATRSSRKTTTSASSYQQSLFDNLVASTPYMHKVESLATTSEHVFHYLSLQERRKITVSFEHIKEGVIYRIHAQRVADNCSIDVSRYIEKGRSTSPLLCYTIDFHSPIGDGLRSIKCTLYSASAKDIPVVWDAIEDYIASVSRYQTMMDIYGHFTEPHPIFELSMDILNTPADDSSFILRFARKFANFEATKKIIPIKDLQELYENEEGKELDAARLVLYLRSLRFDVRVHETNITIPRGYFRCCYPFTLNIHKQISVTWRPTLDSRYTNWLDQALTEAKSLLSNPVTETLSQYEAHPNLSHPLKTIVNNGEVLLGKTVAEGIETIVNNLQHNKYLFSILLTGLVEKLVHPQQDIRSIQADLPGGYSNRSTDQIQVTPFLKRNGLTCCAASGMESGRNLERPIPHTLDYQCKPQGKGNREAYLGIIHAVQVEGIDPFPCMVLLMALDLHRKEHFVFNYPKPQGLTIQQIYNACLQHYALAKGNGRARLPVLAIQAIYQCLVPEISQFRDTVLRNPPHRHTASDKDIRTADETETWIGDIQVDKNGVPFEAIEVKAGKPITSDLVLALPQKFKGYPVNRYYILSTEEQYIAEGQQQEIEHYVSQVRQETGCQVIVNGLQRTLWYYLRLIENLELFLDYYTAQVANDLDTKDEHRDLWVKILTQLDMSQSEALK